LALKWSSCVAVLSRSYSHLCLGISFVMVKHKYTGFCFQAILGIFWTVLDRTNWQVLNYCILSVNASHSVILYVHYL